MSYRLGVDLGMTYTSAAVAVDGRAEMLGLGIRAMQVPSVVFAREDGELVVGEAAEQQGAADPTRVVREFKRRIGDPVPLVVGGSPYSAQALTARLLARVVEVAAERRGGPPDHVCVTHPANWGEFKRDLLRQAVELAGLDGVETSTCTEPEAAAIAYASRDRVAVGDRIAVYDLGGGTFDAAVLFREAAGFRLLGRPKGVEHLGGVDFDEAVYRHVLTALGDVELDDADPATLAGLARLRRDCVEAKEVLSADVDTAIPVALPGVDTRSVRLTRGELDEMLRPAIGETVVAVERALEAARTAPQDLSAILMVGGSSRIPLVSQMLSAAFERPLAIDNHPKHDIALGAALGPAPLAVAAADTAAHPPPADLAPSRAAAHPPPAAVGAAHPPQAGPVPPESPAGAVGVAGPPHAGRVLPDPVEPPAVSAADRTAAHPPPAPPDEITTVVAAAPRPGRPPAPTAPPSSGPRRRRRLLVPSLLAAVLLGALLVLALLPVPPWAELVHREAANAEGALPPFVPPSGVEPPIPMRVQPVAAVTGDTPGLYGGTRSNACDARAIRAHLEADPAKASAWASALGLSPADIGPLLATLTPLTLRTDTAVTNNGFESGRPTPFQSVLQAGTAVLVDPQGLPRVRCYCGNPLSEPDQASAVRYTDPAWDGFDGDSITVIAPAQARIRDFVIVEPDTHEVVTRPTGTNGPRDRPADPGLVKEVNNTFSPVFRGADPGPAAGADVGNSFDEEPAPSPDVAATPGSPPGAATPTIPPSSAPSTTSVPADSGPTPSSPEPTLPDDEATIQIVPDEEPVTNPVEPTYTDGAAVLDDVG